MIRGHTGFGKGSSVIEFHIDGIGNHRFTRTFRPEPQCNGFFRLNAENNLICNIAAAFSRPEIVLRRTFEGYDYSGCCFGKIFACLYKKRNIFPSPVVKIKFYGGIGLYC